MGGGYKKIKNKWTTELPGNIQNYNLQAFLSSKLSTDCGPHILHTQLPLAPALYFKPYITGLKAIIIIFPLFIIFGQYLFCLAQRYRDHQIRVN